MKCPFCTASLKLPRSMAVATCPKCAQSFKAVDPNEEGVVDFAAVQAAAARLQPQPEPEDESHPPPQELPRWINLWGAASVGAAALAVLQGTLGGFRVVTIALTVVGGALVYAGVRASEKRNLDRDRAWFYGAGALNGLVLLLALFAPGIINGWWALDTTPPPRDVHKLVALSRDKPGDEGRVVGSDDWVDAATETIRQEDIVLSVESVKIGRLPDRGAAPFVLIHVRLTFIPTGAPPTFEGFGDQHKPALTDGSGRSLAFQDQRPRGKKGKGPLVFEGPSTGPTELSPSEPLDLLLTFASPPSRSEDLRLEIPSSAWGRQGMCKWRIPGIIDRSQKK
jgi:hypothetical protein